MDYPHRPVLVQEVVKYLVAVPDGTYVDGTVGNGGHSLAIGKGLIEKGSLICLDRDPDAVAISKKRLASLSKRVSVIRASYADLDQVLMELEVEKVDGVLLDLGMSSYQLDKSGRGFSFLRDEPLDMRMDPEDELTARHLVNSLIPKELENILKKYGEERRARSIVRAIVRAREKEPIETSSRLADLIKSISPPSYGSKARHPATRTFQALRVAVNKELQNIEVFLNKIPFLLAKGGRLVILSYHSLEDRCIKKAMFDWEKVCTCPPDFPQCVCGKVPVFKRLFKKGLKPDKGEIDENPRARSAIMRAAERI
ncbi:MAG: 16S rRNA (cytosine(1402)-N(4))-methyltransferase RsmH [Deltaproteobacteria bacterium]|nr:16S rRNA (cytosine(1402)-N(4))-methyltransferase RsmH [Deltaproteobacteria bacterium]